MENIKCWVNRPSWVSFGDVLGVLFLPLWSLFWDFLLFSLVSSSGKGKIPLAATNGAEPWLPFLLLCWDFYLTFLVICTLFLNFLGTDIKLVPCCKSLLTSKVEPTDIFIFLLAFCENRLYICKAEFFVHPLLSDCLDRRLRKLPGLFRINKTFASWMGCLILDYLKPQSYR